VSGAVHEAAPPAGDAELGRHNCNPADCSLGQLIREDFATHDRDWMSEGFAALLVHRLGNARLSVRPRLLRKALWPVYSLFHKLVQVVCGIDLPYTVRIGRRVRIWHRAMIISAISIGDDTHLRQHVTMGVRQRGDPRWLRPVIGARCEIGAGAVIVGGITVGDDCVIGANVVVAQDVPPRSVVTAPKPVIRPRRTESG
jgi:serine O-acetyltransferase